MDIIADTREKLKEWERINCQFQDLGIKAFRSKLFVGDYQSLDNARLVIDRKKDLLELCGNVTQDHERFKRELLKAREAGIHIIVLCEHGEGIKELRDVYCWQNPRRKIMIRKRVNGVMRWCPKYPYATTGPHLYKILVTMRDEYDVQFLFCDKNETGREIVRLLGGDAGG